MIVQTPKPPYVAVIFTSLRAEGHDDHGAMAERMADIAKRQQSFESGT